MQKTKQGATVVDTGKYTGRATKDRYICLRPETDKTIHWSDINKPMSLGDVLTMSKSLEHHLDSPLTLKFSGFVGAHKIEVHSSSSWHIDFCKNMFRQAPAPISGLNTGEVIKIFHEPKLHPSRFLPSYKSDALIVLDPYERKVWIVGTAYAGEIKKAAFATCNYLLPELGYFPMHASANCKKDGSESCVLFGLSGTGKTTLSADPERALIGDDEIVWAPTGLFNLEGGCYAKLIDLKESQEPEIWKAIHSSNAILENVGFNPTTKEVDFSDRSKTENTRGSYPLSALSNVFDQNKLAQNPKTVVFLMADAFGAMPACARLSTVQAQRFFLSGYTAKVAGTEVGVKEPQAVFSACFGEPFMPLAPKKYAQMLAEHMEASGTQVWLLNTGWTSGGYLNGKRYPLAVSRQLLKCIQSGELAKEPTVQHPVFEFQVPTRCPGVDAKYLSIPSGEVVEKVAALFAENQKKFD